MVKLIVLVFVILCVVATVFGQRGDCPSSSQHTVCTPKCIADHECTSMGGKCCSNICNLKSCVIPKNSAGSTNKYSGSAGGGSGSYCGNVKCNSFEKCELDRTTKRQKCVRG